MCKVVKIITSVTSQGGSEKSEIRTFSRFPQFEVLRNGTDELFKVPCIEFITVAATKFSNELTSVFLLRLFVHIKSFAVHAAHVRTCLRGRWTVILTCIGDIYVDMWVHLF